MAHRLDTAISQVCSEQADIGDGKKVTDQLSLLVQNRNALEITFLNTEGIFIVTDAASSPNSTERKLLIDRLAPVPGLVPILEQAAASTASKIIDQGKVLVTPQTCAVETIERILVAVARLGSQSSESLPMPNGH